METLLLSVFVSSLVMILAIVKLAKSKNCFVNEADLQGVQKFHYAPVARIGGLPIFIAWSIAAFLMDDQSGLIFKIWLSSLPVFIVFEGKLVIPISGLYDDISPFKVSWSK